MGDNGEAKLSGAEKPILETGGTQEPKPEVKPEPEKPITDFKIAEIWIRSGRIMLDALPGFMEDKCRAIGVLDYCKDIVKEHKMPENKIIPARGSMMNFARNIFKRKN